MHQDLPIQGHDTACNNPRMHPRPPPSGPLFCLAVFLAGAAAGAQAQDATKAQQALQAAVNETRAAETAASKADTRAQRAEANLKAAQSDHDTAQRERRAAQARLSSARAAENRARRELDAAQKVR